jgi:hypothetical protein
MSEVYTTNRDPRDKRVKRNYSKPTLIRHGNLREITLHVGSSGAYDASPHSSGHYNTK